MLIVIHKSCGHKNIQLNPAVDLLVLIHKSCTHKSIQLNPATDITTFACIHEWGLSGRDGIKGR